MRALPGRRSVIRPLACRRQLSSDDDRLPFNRGICLPETDDPGHDLVRKPDINENHVVVRMVNDAVQECNELGVTLDREAALKQRELQPLAKTLHDTEHTSPPLRVGDVVRHKIKVFFAHRGSTRCEVRILGQLTEQVATEQPGLKLQQASVTQLVAKYRMCHFLAESPLECSNEALAAIIG
jgi:hypothetical protein